MKEINLPKNSYQVIKSEKKGMFVNFGEEIIELQSKVNSENQILQIIVSKEKVFGSETEFTYFQNFSSILNVNEHFYSSIIICIFGKELNLNKIWKIKKKYLISNCQIQFFESSKFRLCFLSDNSSFHISDFEIDNLELKEQKIMRIPFKGDKPQTYAFLNQDEMNQSILIGTQLGKIFLINICLNDSEKYNFEKVFNENSNFGISSLKTLKTYEEKTNMFVVTTFDGFFKIFKTDCMIPLFETQFYSKPLKNLRIDASKLLFYFIDELEKEGLTSLHFFLEANQLEKNETNFFKKVKKK